MQGLLHGLGIHTKIRAVTIIGIYMQTRSAELDKPRIPGNALFMLQRAIVLVHQLSE
ncbi:hypothetical protein NIES4073_80560 [Kalymmatonema gypsitolerans NIES-4073]|nr:hypothetical protein NIES4073_80560 [Scytonema sp. NIES-4073]